MATTVAFGATRQNLARSAGDMPWSSFRLRCLKGKTERSGDGNRGAACAFSGYGVADFFAIVAFGRTRIRSL